MHKKLEAELVSLAHSILQMKNKEDIDALHKKAHAIYEKLSVLKFVDSYLEAKSGTLETKEEIIDKIDTVFKESIIDEEPEVTPIMNEVEEKELQTKEQVEEVIEKENPTIKNDIEEIPSLQISLEEEFKDAISADVATQLFEKATKENPVIEEKVEEKQRSLNDTLFSNNIQVGLNDKIAFVKHLFEGSQEDFNRVISQLNSFKTEEEAKNFIKEFVKPDYDWNGKETYEERLMSLIERKFL